MLLSPEPSLVFEELEENQLLEKVLPEIYPLIAARHNRYYHPEGEPWEHTLIVIELVRKKTDNLNVLWAALLHDIGKPSTEKHLPDRITNHGHDKVGAEMAVRLLKRLEAPQEQIDEVEFLVKEHMRIKKVKEMRKKKIAKIKESEYYENLKILAIADSEATRFPGCLDWVEAVEEV